jgi:hypothetical protein
LTPYHLSAQEARNTRDRAAPSWRQYRGQVVEERMAAISHLLNRGRTVLRGLPDREVNRILEV